MLKLRDLSVVTQLAVAAVVAAVREVQVGNPWNTEARLADL